MGNNQWLFQKKYEEKKEIHTPAVDSDLWQKIQSLTFLQGKHGFENEFYAGVLEIMTEMSVTMDMSQKNAVALLIGKQEQFLNKQAHAVCSADDHKPLMKTSDLPCHNGRWGFKF